eukprot:CAMPEP_0185204258 /NCGR_PEP_ID=MMETSP1140-20130426/54501_1 /TAXON_ID=298111 /ORGANISM="Pavlova sp., Strain CCMP459" /LENGTH=68 /DNA_ID=CAMNT_0027771799 /DNA_START=33 /DNA_END=236 /DNA_ORIENTATION=-
MCQSSTASATGTSRIREASGSAVSRESGVGRRHARTTRSQRASDDHATLTVVPRLGKAEVTGLTGAAA